VTSSPSDKSDGKQARNAEAMRRLEELLRDAGPGITVRPVPEGTDRSGPYYAPDENFPTSGFAARIEPSAEPAPSAAIPPAASAVPANATPNPEPFSEPQRQVRRSSIRSAVAQTATNSAARPAPAAAAANSPASPARPPAAVVPTARAPQGPSVTETALRHMPATVRNRLNDLVDGKITTPPPPIGSTAPVREASRAAPAEPQRQRPVRPGESELWLALDGSRKPFYAAGVYSFVINLLMLAGPIFMLQVYDRVLVSGSMPTLLALTFITSAAYGIIGLLELARTRIIARIGLEFDQRVSNRIFEATLKKTVDSPAASTHALRELDNLRQFVASPAPLTFFDLPWAPIYLLVVAIVHWALGVTAVLGALALFVITWASDARSKVPLMEAGKTAAQSLDLAETSQRNAESILAMGMLGSVRDRWRKTNAQSLSWQLLAADRIGSMSSFSKALRLFLQSIMLAIGAALAVQGEISAGAIIAGTIIFGRALAPIEAIIGHWKGFIKARDSYNRLDKLLATTPVEVQRTALPTPRGQLHVDGLRVAAPDSRTLILGNITFQVEPGQMLAVIGPSASGKSTLARCLVGLWKPVSGVIRLDGSRFDQWDPEDLGQHFGFLPQNVELFAGSVKDNISRFRSDATDTEIIDAAKAAHAHDLIMELPHGYETQLGAFGTYLSSGQRQRIALARALFRNPALVVLDEPNSNLDREGDEALAAAVDGMRARGQAVVLVSHRVQAIGKADLILYIDAGVQRAFGPKAEVMKLFQGQQPGASAQPQRRQGDGASAMTAPATAAAPPRSA
jgi:PrtD family type I secretion system ABC transporter